jgi:hypothetical protein
VPATRHAEDRDEQAGKPDTDRTAHADSEGSEGTGSPSWNPAERPAPLAVSSDEPVRAAFVERAHRGSLLAWQELNGGDTQGATLEALHTLYADLMQLREDTSTRLKRVDRRLEQVDSRLEGVDRRLDLQERPSRRSCS